MFRLPAVTRAIAIAYKFGDVVRTVAIGIQFVRVRAQTAVILALHFMVPMDHMAARIIGVRIRTRAGPTLAEYRADYRRNGLR
jgi:hypothetical protein